MPRTTTTTKPAETAKAPSNGSTAPSAADKDAQRGGSELGQDVDCVLADSDLVRNTAAAQTAPKSAKRPSARAHKPRSGPDR